MLSVVTGAAGFIGSHLCDRLLDLGHHVRAVDCFTDSYDPREKRSNLDAAAARRHFSLHELDLRTDALDEVIAGADVVFHQAGQPGVRASWAELDAYLGNNVLAVQRLLDACTRQRTRRVVVGSSSSVYGNAARYPCREDGPVDPFSPYGVTKLAAEHLCRAHSANSGLSTVLLRYFTVYGPRQRPDMAFRRMISAALTGSTFPCYGDGSAVRDFTFVGDVVTANLAAASADVGPAEVINVAGGSSARLDDTIDLVGRLVGRPVPVEPRPSEPGDVDRTGGDIAKAGRLLGWAPETVLADGLAAQIAWQRGRPEA